MSVSGLALSIRGSTESDTFDLAGQSPASITTAVTGAFGTPFPLRHMIRLTFVTGAGKLGRQKYDDGAARALTAALRRLGYEEDRAASCVVECAGTFKSQHDTGKNLKTVVVFPTLLADTEDDDNNDQDNDNGPTTTTAASVALLPAGTPSHMCAVGSLPVFTKMLAAKCRSWSQKKNCVGRLQSVGALLRGFEDQLSRGEALADADQDLYDTVTYDSLAHKEALCKQEMQAQVEAGDLTRADKDALLAQIAEKTAALTRDLKEAADKPKKADRLRLLLDKARTRQKKVEDIVPQAPHRLKHEGDIVKLRVEMAPLQKMEDAAKGRLLSMKETMTLARKQDILEEIQEFEKKSRGWFESDEAFETRLEASRKSTQTSAKQRASKKGGGGGSKTSASSNNSSVYRKPSTNWVTPGMKTQKKAPAKKKVTASNVFSMMMMDSDSD